MIRLAAWTENTLKPFIAKVLTKMKDTKNRNENKPALKDMFRALQEQFLARLENDLKEGKADYFSGESEYNVIDIIIHSELQQVVLMGTTKQKLPHKFPKLA